MRGSITGLFIGLILAGSPAAGADTAGDCAKALRAGASGATTYNTTRAEEDWASKHLSGPLAAQPSPSWCSPALAAPAQFSMHSAMQCQALHENRLSADPTVQPLLDAFRPIVKERILDEGRTPDDEFTAGWMSRYRREAPLWEPAAASEFRNFCLKAQADYPVAKAFDDERELRIPHKHQCLAVIVSETQAGRWHEIDPEEREWAVTQELTDFSSDVAPSGACLSRWRPGMTYDPSGQSVIERAPERDMLARIGSTQNTDMRARGLALMRRGGSDAGRWSIYPSKSAILAMTLEDALATISGVNEADWRAMAMGWLYETKDPQQMLALADFVLNSGPLFDSAAGADLFARAADRGSPYAIYRLGRLYLNGLGVAKDEGLGEQYLAVAARAGIREAEQLLLSRQGARDEARRAELEAQYWSNREAIAWRRFEFSLKCGYSPPDDEHDWICVE